jgi:hypothetical protein
MSIVLNVVMLHVLVLNVDSSECHCAESRYAKCHCADCRYAECHVLSVTLSIACVPSVQTCRTAHAKEICPLSVTTWKRKDHTKKLKRH